MANKQFIKHFDIALHMVDLKCIFQPTSESIDSILYIVWNEEKTVTKVNF